jgi:peptide/nickel transport system substrate-binding protein
MSQRTLSEGEMMKHWQWLCPVVLSAILLGNAAWSRLYAEPHGTVVMALDTEIPTLDPWAHASHAGLITTNWHIHDNLFARDTQTMKPLPGLAVSATPINALTWEIKLRQGVTFHNGEALTAAVVKFNIDRVLAPENGLQRRTDLTWLNDTQTAGEGDALTVVDDYTLHVHTKVPYPLMHESLTTWPMISQTHFERVGADGYATHPVGTGPFRFVEWV